MSGDTRLISNSLSKLAASQAGIGGRSGGLFTPYIVYGVHQLQWMNTTLGGIIQLSNASSTVDDPDMAFAILRLTGPQLEASMFGAILLSAWLDFLNLADLVLQQYPFYSVEQLFMDMHRVQKMIEPLMTALSSLEPEQVETATTAIPNLMGQLTHEFNSIRQAVRGATERGGQIVLAAQLVEMLTQASTMKISLPRLPPAAPATLGVGLVMGTNGVMMGSRMVVSTEWVEMMRRLAQAGVVSAPVISAAVRIHAGQMMSHSNEELPKGVREALGDGPEVRGMRVTGRARAGMAAPPRHHVLPREHREWFEKRGFTGDMRIDQFCVKMEQAHHEAIHGGGDWRLGRTWAGEWNRLIMKALLKAETNAGRMLTRDEILNIVAERMKDYSIPMNFTRWRGP